MLGERRHLRALQVRVGGQDRLDVLPCPPHEHPLQRAQRLDLTFDHAPQMQADVGHDLIVAAAPGVQLRPSLADDLGEPALHRHVHVLVLVARHEGAALDLAPHGGEAVLDRLALGAGERAGALQAARVRGAPFDVLAPQAPVEGERRVERDERGVALAGEAARARDRHDSSSFIR